MSTPDIETAEVLARKAAIGTREVDLRRDLGILIGCLLYTSDAADE